MPRKYNYKVPKGTKDCEGKECDKDYNFEIEIPDDMPSVTHIPTPQITGQPAAQVLAPQIPIPQTPAPKEPESKKMSHEELADLIPNGLNAMSCPGGDCGHMKLKNKNQTTKWKACPHCEANTLHKDSEFCPYCTKNVDKDDLEDGLELEQAEEE